MFEEDRVVRTTLSSSNMDLLAQNLNKTVSFLIALLV